MKKVLATLFLLALTGMGLMAQIPADYYNNANGKTGDDLKIALHDIIKDHTSISYSNIWTAFWSTDNKGNGVVWDMYSDIPNGSQAYTYSMGQNQCGEYVQEGDCYNREHSWPQSWFSGDDQAVPSRDLHHVFPTDGFVNAQRSNYPFGEVNNASWTSQNGSKLGSCKASLDFNGTVFEPIDEYKGDFARALMYMSVRYYGEDENWGTSGMTNKSEILPWAMTMLLRWSDNDPVSQKEIDRNNVIYKDYQHNRNPFVDHPEYARMIWDPNWHEGLGGYVKVTNSEELTDGDYLIVSEEDNVAFNGALTTLDVVGNKIDVTISGNLIESNNTTDAAVFTVTAKTGGYSIKSASGYYIGNTSDANVLKTSLNDDYVNLITITNDGNADIVSSSSHLRYNNASDQNRFRYYKSSSYTNQKAIQLYKKIEVYSINLADVENGSISADALEAIEGTTITLTATPDPGYELDCWMVTDASNNTIPVTENQFVMPASNVTVGATFVYVGEPFARQYYLVTSVDQLVAGRTYLIVNTEAQKAMGATSSSGNNRTAVDAGITDNVISTLGDANEFVLGGSTNAWTFFDAQWGNKGGYLYASSSSTNQLKTQVDNNDNGKWSIVIASDGTATIVAQGSNTRNNLRYNPNNGSPIFSCYDGSSAMAKVELYICSEEFDHTEDATIATIFSFDKHIVRSGVTLTVSGTAACNDASHLILEEGAQFVHHNDGVMATFKKSVEAYTDDGGWYTIATPFVSYAPAGTMVGDNYDLYAFNEAGPLEYVNHKKGDGFDLIPGQGYLYAHHPAATLRMTGTLNSGDYSQTVNLSYSNSSANLKGFNILGNPTAHEIGFSKTESVSDGYYYLNNNEAWVYTTATTVPAGRGFMVKANAENQSVTLNPQSRRSESREEGRYLCVNIGEAKAYVKLNEGVSMPLADLKGKHSDLYFLSDHRPYTMLVRDGAEALDLCFEPRSNGSMTLTVDAEGLGLGYLHLIDLKTGADVDLLTTPSYVFKASTKDYATRFRLVFNESGPSTGSETEDSAFAYYANGEIRMVETCHGASLQMMDMTGRTVLTVGDVSGNVSTMGMTPGVYVLRLVTDDTIRVQKIVVE